MARTGGVCRGGGRGVTARVGDPLAVPSRFLAIVSHSRIFRTPTPLDLALGQIDAWLESPSLVVLSENDQYLENLREIVLPARLAGARIHDARVAALCLSHGVRELWTADRDFSMFPQLNTRNPLIG